VHDDALAVLDGCPGVTAADGDAVGDGTDRVGAVVPKPLSMPREGASRRRTVGWSGSPASVSARSCVRGDRTRRLAHQSSWSSDTISGANDASATTTS
jgi:hypothetical protein